MKNLLKYANEITADKSPATITNYTHAVELFVKAVKVTAIEKITIDHARKFATYLKKHTPTAATAKYYYNITRSIFQQAANEGIIDINPLAGIKPIKADSKPRAGVGREKALTLEELELLRATPAADNVVKRAFLFSVETGLRISDVEALQYSDIKPVAGMLHIVKKCHKTGVILNVPLTPRALELINGGKGTGIIFALPTLKGGAVNRMHILRTLKEWTKKAGVTKKVSFHTARHTFCTNVYNATGDILVTKELAGHSDISTTARYYAAVTNATLQRAMKALF